VKNKKRKKFVSGLRIDSNELMSDQLDRKFLTSLKIYGAIKDMVGEES
jgi:hypothetical protein